MATYAIGDLQGCFEPLERLLAHIAFDRTRDRLWFVGDLVNRGPDSLACLRFVHGLGERAVSVLGNHDIHLLCIAEGVERARPRDTLDAVLEAPDRAALLEWLRHRPLFHVEQGFALVHAGLAPEWTVAQAAGLAAEVEAQLRAPDYRDFLARLYGDEPARWSAGLSGMDRFRAVVNAMTRLRMCRPDGSMALGFKGEPGEASAGLVAWFDMPGRASRDHAIVCGHWSALGVCLRPELLSLDSGCVWGRALTAVRLEDRALFQVECPPGAGPEG
jgi:bis(5'-nucleosyl)-tetraphosphatase (symmetrical)